MRIDRDEYYMRIAEVTAERSTCHRRKVGAVIVNGWGHIMSTGYNGVPSKLKHCNDSHPCDVTMPISGLDLDKCNAVHAEQNALLQCNDVGEIWKIYVTAMPCIHCQKMLLNTMCNVIVYRDPYPTDTLWDRAIYQYQEGILLDRQGVKLRTTGVVDVPKWKPI